MNNEQRQVFWDTLISLEALLYSSINIELEEDVWYNHHKTIMLLGSMSQVYGVIKK